MENYIIDYFEKQCENDLKRLKKENINISFWDILIDHIERKMGK